MTPQLWKEIRCLLPAAVATLTIPTAVQLCFGHTHFAANDGIPIFAIFVAFVAAASFGGEWTNGTFAQLLTQPITRVGLWNYKLAVLSVCIISVAIPFGLSTANPRHDWPLLLLPVFCAVGLTPCLTLVFRDGLVATAITLTIEWLILLFGFQMFRWRTLHPGESHLSPRRQTAIILAASILATAGWFAGRRVLQNWQAIPSRRLTDMLPAFRWTPHFFLTRRSRASAVMSLVFKELHLHAFNLLLMVFFCIPFLLILLRPDFADDALAGWFKFYSFVFPISVGAITISREMQLGVLDGQLVLPVSVARQWAIKLAVCFTICVVGAIVLPWALLCLRTALHPAFDHHWFKVFDELTEVVIFAALTIVCSTVAGGTLRAVIVGLSVSFVSLIYYGWIVNTLGETRFVRGLEYFVNNANAYIVNRYMFIALALFAIVLILRPAFEHFRRPRAAISIPYLLLHTTVLLTIFRFALLLIPMAAG